MRSFSKKIVLKIHRKLLRKKYAYLESILIRIIKESEGKIENIPNTKEEIKDSRLGKYLLRIYDSPPTCPPDVRVIIDRYTRGENWEYFWSKACFFLLPKLDLEIHYKTLKQIISLNHLFFTLDALGAICTDPAFFKAKENLNFIRKKFYALDSWSAIAWIHYLAKVKIESINELILNEIKKRFNRPSQHGYMQISYIIKELYEANNPIWKQYSYYLLEIARSSSPEMEEKYSTEFNFTSAFKARSLMRFLKEDPTNPDALVLHQNWLNTEQDPEIIAILTGKID